MEKSSESEEKLIFSFEIQNCEQDYYYQISVCDDKDNFKTSEILCENGGNIISFKESMEYTFIFEKRQKFTLIISKKKMYNKSEETPIIVYLSNIVSSKNGISIMNLNDYYNSEIISIKAQKNKEDKDKKYLFDYFKSGIKLSCFISFDFSQKNNQRIKDDNLSILKNIFQSIESYTEDRKYFSSGFGAKTKESKSSVFNIAESKLNSDELIEKYKTSLESKNIIPEKTISLSPLIKKITTDIYEIYDPTKYNVLFVLISKDLDKKDKKSLIHQINASSYLPLSIFIIGIGNNDFTEAKGTLKKISKFSSEGLENIRNNIIFTTFNSLVTASKTCSICLKELSKQMIQYYIYNKYFPENDEKENKKKLEQSINMFNKIQNNNNIDDKNDNIEKNNENNEVKNQSKSTPIEEQNIEIKYSTPDDVNTNNISVNINSNPNNNPNPNKKYSLKSSEFYPKENQDNPFSKNASSKTTYNSQQ